MKIAINAHLAGSSDRAGIPNYITNLIDSLVKIENSNEYFIFSNQQYPDYPNVKIINSNIPINNSVSRILWEQIFLPGQINRLKTNIFHYPDHILPLFNLKCKRIITVHDLAFIKLPHVFPFAKRQYKTIMIKNAVLNADRIIAVSQSTKKDILEKFDVDPAKIKVIYNGLGENFRVISEKNLKSDIIRKYNLKIPFILFVGTLEPRKNIIRLIKAFSLSVKRDNIPHDLIVLGQKGWMFKDGFKVVSDLKLESRVRFLSGVSQEDLPVIYNLADLFVYPSLYEGFGFPLLEAMACGTPVITSNISSLPEIAGDAAVLIDPYNVEKISESINRILLNKKFKEDLINKGSERAKLFTWEKCAQETLDLYTETQML